MSAVLISLRIKAKLLQKAKLRAGKPYKLKDAFQLLATQAGYDDWRALKQAFEDDVDFCPHGSTALWKAWYATHEEALAHLQDGGGWLLPYRRQFFVCDVHYIEFLGIAHDDADLQAVGRDWSQPRDTAAYARLLARVAQRRPVLPTT